MIWLLFREDRYTDPVRGEMASYQFRVWVPGFIADPLSRGIMAARAELYRTEGICIDVEVLSS